MEVYPGAAGKSILQIIPIIFVIKLLSVRPPPSPPIKKRLKQNSGSYVASKARQRMKQTVKGLILAVNMLLIFIILIIIVYNGKFVWCFCSLVITKWQWPWNNFCQQYYSTSFFCVKYILFISRFKKEKKDILIFITIKKNNIRIMRRFTTCFKFFSKSCCMYRAMRLQN